jgi:hypothetical protein
MIRNTYKTQQVPSITEIINSIETESIDPKILCNIRNDFNRHLSTLTGSLDNYCGLYPKSVIQAIMKHRPDIISENEVKSFATRKIHSLYENMASLVMNNQRINFPPQILKMLDDYINPKENHIQNIVINNDFIESPEGKHTLPESKDIN